MITKLIQILAAAIRQIRKTLIQNLNDALVAEIPQLTRREICLWSVPGKAIAVIGMRRSGKACFLSQCMADLPGGIVAHRGFLRDKIWLTLPKALLLLLAPLPKGFECPMGIDCVKAIEWILEEEISARLS